MASVKLLDKTRVDSSFIEFRFECPPEFEAFPGQFVLLQATINDESFGRHYSISSPFVRDTFEITVAVDGTGTVSSWLAQREPGDSVEVQGPFGQNYYEGGYPVVVLASGPGIGAALGIAERAAATETGYSVLFHHPTLIFEHKLSQLATTGQSVLYVQKDLGAGIELVMNNGELLVFGFQDFITAVRSILSDYGVDIEAVKFENYG